jgi:hypothetical protein
MPTPKSSAAKLAAAVADREKVRRELAQAEAIIAKYVGPTHIIRTELQRLME